VQALVQEQVGGQGSQHGQGLWRRTGVRSEPGAAPIISFLQQFKANRV